MIDKIRKGDFMGFMHDTCDMAVNRLVSLITSAKRKRRIILSMKVCSGERLEKSQ